MSLQYAPPIASRDDDTFDVFDNGEFSSEDELFHRSTSNDNLLKGRYRFDVDSDGKRIMIGEGESSYVFRGCDVYDLRPVAIKVTKFNDPTYQGVAIEEAKKLKYLRHPHIIECYDAFYSADEDPEEMVVVEYCEHGDLGNYFAHVPPAFNSLALKSDLMLQITEALKFLHETKKMMHRDLKPGNILISGPPDAPIAKLCDFVTAKTMEAQNFCNSYVGTPTFLAPEVGVEEYSLKADIFSLGVVFTCILAGDVDVYFPMPPSVIVKNGMASELFRIIEMNLPKECYIYMPLLRLMLKKQPDDRPDLDTILTEIRRLAPKTKAGAAPPLTSSV